MNEDPMNGAKGIAAGLLLSMALWAAVILLLARGCHAGTLTENRIAKARVVVALYPHEGRHDFYPWVGTLVKQHERYGDRGFAAAWYWSLVYGGANADLRCYARFPGACYGPLDVKGHADAWGPRRNIERHVAQMWTAWGKGYRGMGLCRYVMYPSRPHDWGGGKFAQANARHCRAINEAYRKGELK